MAEFSWPKVSTIRWHRNSRSFVNVSWILGYFRPTAHDFLSSHCCETCPHITSRTEEFQHYDVLYNTAKHRYLLASSHAKIPPYDWVHWRIWALKRFDYSKLLAKVLNDDDIKHIMAWKTRWTWTAKETWPTNYTVWHRCKGIGKLLMKTKLCWINY